MRISLLPPLVLLIVLVLLLGELPGSFYHGLMKGPISMEEQYVPTPAPVDVPLPPLPTATIQPVPELPVFPAQQVVTTLQAAGGTFGVALYDEASGADLYQQHADQVFSAASLIKLPIALMLYQQAQQGSINLDERLTLQQTDKVGGAGAIQYDPVGTTYSLRELCARMIADSDNTATNMLIDRLGGFAPINTLLEQMGTSQTRLQRHMMDMAARQAGRDNLTSAADVLRMLQALTQQTVVEHAGAQEILAAMGRTRGRNKIPARLPPDATVFNKTGELPNPGGVEHDAAIIVTPTGRRYVLVVLSGGWHNNQAAVAAIAETSRIVFDYEAGLGAP